MAGISGSSIIGVALDQGGKFLGWLDKKGKVRKAKSRRIKNPVSYRITKRGGYWYVMLAGQETGPFATRKKALTFARRKQAYY